MMWRTLLAAALLLPPMAYVAGTLVADEPAPDQRPALVLEDEPGPAGSERQVTIREKRDDRPGPRDPAPRPRDDDRDEDADDRDDDEAVVVRPIPDEVDDDDDGDDDDDDGGRDRDD